MGEHKLSQAQRDALGYVYPARDTIHEYDRNPERWVRYLKRPTIDALVRMGLVVHAYGDYPVGGWRGELTDEGMRVRAELRAASDE